MRVAFDEQIFAIQRFGGISRLFAELARQFATGTVEDIELVPISAPIVNRYLLDDQLVSKALRVTEARSSYTALARYLALPRPKGGADIVHNTFYLPHGLAGFSGAKRIVTVHDMIPERMPWTRRRLDFLTLKRRYIQRADHIICVSEATREDMLDFYGHVAAPITVVHHGVDPVFRPESPRWPDLPDRYVLFVGNRGQYKDADVLLRAFAMLADTHPEVELLFVGGGQLNRAEREQIDALGVRGKVTQRSLPDAEMAAAYGQALLCVFPSRYEGFGLPALEAMACGTTTVLARATSLPEVGGDAAAYFEPGDADALAAQMTRLLDDSDAASALRKRGIERASGFSWSRCAAETAAVYRGTLA